MPYSDPTYVIFDGDNDAWAYRFMKGWNVNERLNFNFNNAHDLDTMTSRAQDEDYVKRNLRSRMKQSSMVVALIGAKTKNLFKFVRWELELAQDLNLPIIAVNLNESRVQDEFCPPIIRDKCVVHVPFKLKPIQYAMQYWPTEYKAMPQNERDLGARFYSAQKYKEWGL